MKRSRRGGRRPQPSHNGGNGGPHNPNRTFDSNGPDVKIRGSASHVYEKYLQLARDANAAGDRVTAENYLQHAEHYYRIMAANQTQAQQYQQPSPANSGQQRPQTGSSEQPFSQSQPEPPTSAPSFSLTESPEAEEESEEGEEAEAPE